MADQVSSQFSHILTLTHPNISCHVFLSLLEGLDTQKLLEELDHYVEVCEDHDYKNQEDDCQSPTRKTNHVQKDLQGSVQDISNDGQGTADDGQEDHEALMSDRREKLENRMGEGQKKLENRMSEDQEKLENHRDTS